MSSDSSTDQKIEALTKQLERSVASQITMQERLNVLEAEVAALKSSKAS